MLGSSRAMLASDVGIEMLAILSHEDAYNSVDPLSSEDVAVIVDFDHWFTDCHLEAIFYMNSSRLRLDLRPPSTGKMFVWSPAFLLEPGSTRYSSAPSITTVWSNYQTSYNDFKEVYITETVTLSPNGRFDQFNSLINLSTRSCDQSFFVLIGQNRLQLMSVMTIHKYVNVQASVVGPQ